MTYAEKELGPLGFRLVRETTCEVVMALGHIPFLFHCDCLGTHRLANPNCPVHAENPNACWTVAEAKNFAKFHSGDHGMSLDKLASAVEAVRRKLDSMNVESSRYEQTELLPKIGRVAAAMGHLRYMCDKMGKYLDEGRREKVMRWLSFMQGALWALRLAPISEMKEDVRPAE